MSDQANIAAIAARWDGVTKGYERLTFAEAKADMDALLAEVHRTQELRRRINDLERQLAKRNADMREFAAEVNRLAETKYREVVG